MYNVYPFTVDGKNRLAVALDEEIAILDLDASPVVPSQSNITSPDNDPFTVGHNSSDCNDYYGAEENPFKPTGGHFACSNCLFNQSHATSRNLMGANPQTSLQLTTSSTFRMVVELVGIL